MNLGRSDLLIETDGKTRPSAQFGRLPLQKSPPPPKESLIGRVGRRVAQGIRGIVRRRQRRADDPKSADEERQKLAGRETEKLPAVTRDPLSKVKKMAARARPASAPSKEDTNLDTNRLSENLTTRRPLLVELVSNAFTSSFPAGSSVLGAPGNSPSHKSPTTTSDLGLVTQQGGVFPGKKFLKKQDQKAKEQRKKPEDLYNGRDSITDELAITQPTRTGLAVIARAKPRT